MQTHTHEVTDPGTPTPTEKINFVSDACVLPMGYRCVTRCVVACCIGVHACVCCQHYAHPTTHTTGRTFTDVPSGQGGGGHTTGRRIAYGFVWAAPTRWLTSAQIHPPVSLQYPPTHQTRPRAVPFHHRIVHTSKLLADSVVRRTTGDKLPVLVITRAKLGKVGE